MLHKTFELIETKTDGDAGSFTALASVFGNVDRVGDRMLPGSFSKTLENWRQTGKPLPVILSHSWDDPHKYVGEADPRAVYEDGRGLVVQGKMYTDEPVGKKVYDLMKRGILTGWSFGYKVPKGGQAKKDGVNEISEVELFEVGPTLVGANAEAQLQEIKSVLGVEESEKAPEPETISLKVHDKEMKALRNELEGDLAELREAVEVLQTSHQDQRNEEPSRAKSPPDSLREESRKAVQEVMLDGIRRLDIEPSPPAPEPEIDIRELRKQSRAVMASILKE